MSKWLVFSIGLILFSCSEIKTQTEQKYSETQPEYILVDGDKIERVMKTEDDWKSELTDMEFYVLRKKGTERPFTGVLLKNKTTGVYQCKACGLPLFHSDTKFKSGTGWPSFYQPYNDDVINQLNDNTLGMSRVEVTCARCDGHLGHVFPDGPKPTGLRYCINSVSLQFEEGK